MDVTAMPMWATRAGDSLMAPVNITIAREGVEGYGSGTLHGRYGRHVRVGSRTAPGAHDRGLLGDLVLFDFQPERGVRNGDRKSTRLNSSHVRISYAVFCLKKKKKQR